MSNVSGDQSIDVTPTSGMDLRSLSKTTGPAFLQNIITRNGELAVRSGFGLVREYGTSLNCGRLNEIIRPNWGLGKCIGATHVRTPWGTDQILAIHGVYNLTANLALDDTGASLSGKLGVMLAGVSAVVHDLHTGRFVEFVLHHQDTNDTDLRGVYPNYATRIDEDHLQWVRPVSEPKWATFTPFASNVMINIDGVGICTYRPVEFVGPVDRKNHAIGRTLLPYGPGEQSAFSLTALCDGAFSPEQAYLRTVEFGTVTAMCSFNDRMVFATGPVLWFTDPYRPDNILTTNFQILPTNDAIVAIAQSRDTLVITTARQSWLMVVTIGGTAVGGSLIQLSSSVGCVGPRALTQADGTIYFVEDSGVRVYQGGEVQSLSDEVDRLWTDKQSLQMVLTDYYTKNGITSLVNDQLPARIDVRKQMATARLAWHQDRETLFCVCDDVTLVWTRGFGWSVWYYATHSGSATSVIGRQEIVSPVIVAIGEDVYLIGGPDQTQYIYEDAETRPPRVIRSNDKSCYLLKLGRGGALDRNADASLEDEREPIGGWTPVLEPSASEPAFFIGKYKRIPAGYSLFSGITLGPTTQAETYWFPVSLDLATPYGTAPDQPVAYQLSFTFDNTLWRPFVLSINPADPDYGVVAAVYPSERLSSVPGYAVTGTSEFRVYDGVNVDPLGSTVSILWDGALCAGTTAPQMNVSAVGPSPLFWIGFEKIGTASVIYLAKSIGLCLVGPSASPGRSAGVYQWQNGVFPIEQQALDDKAQAVDWVAKSAEFRVKGDQFKIRGVFVDAVHWGKQTGADATVTLWPYGPLNTATSTDMRDYSGQALDFTTAPPGNSQQTGLAPVARLMPTGTSTPTLKTANNVARWGTQALDADGNLLIDDAAVDVMGTTDGSQGERGSVMVHGTMLGPGEGVRVGRLEAVVRVVGNRRRWK